MMKIQDPLVEPAAEGVNIVAALASSTLTRKREERIINPALQHNTDPPWGEVDMQDWAKGGSPPKGLSVLVSIYLQFSRVRYSAHFWSVCTYFQFRYYPLIHVSKSRISFNPC